VARSEGVAADSPAPVPSLLGATSTVAEPENDAQGEEVPVLNREDPMCNNQVTIVFALSVLAILYMLMQNNLDNSDL
jgi:hypothetical protein